ncbi:hypothetical protein LTR02_010505 [Friedmanniomyces endolithicus]|nr:hypothetical protein LTR03_016612 [Friedmanniomyces endolithicus]KAK0897742.1 hypothetical protein LTR02_010505 [Friedmanniomyces endolithicus]
MASEGHQQVHMSEQKVKMAGKRRPTVDAFCTTTRPITVVVSSNGKEQTFYCHEELLTTHSDFFAAAMRKEWTEGQARIVRLSMSGDEEMRGNRGMNLLPTGP